MRPSRVVSKVSNTSIKPQSVKQPKNADSASGKVPSAKPATGNRVTFARIAKCPGYDIGCMAVMGFLIDHPLESHSARKILESIFVPASRTAAGLRIIEGELAKLEALGCAENRDGHWSVAFVRDSRPVEWRSDEVN